MFLQKFLANIVNSFQINILIINLAKSNTISTLFSILKQFIDINESVIFDNLFDNNLLNRIIDLNEIEVFQNIIVLRTIIVTLYTCDYYLVKKLVLLYDLESYVARENEASFVSIASIDLAF